MNAASNLPIIDNSSMLVSIGHFLVSVWGILVIVVRDVISFLIAISFPVSVFLLIGIIYCVERLKQIRKKEEEIYDKKVEPAFETVEKGDPELSHRFDNVMIHINGASQNDWRLAIMEADIILDDILTKIGYRGESIGEKLKRATKADFKSLDDAWEAHKIRNQIAHEGSNFAINQEEAKRVIGLYRKVFKEFYYI